MGWKHFSRKKTLEILLAEMAGEHRLHRVLGPIALTSLGVGAIIGAGIFVMTGRAAAEYAGPAIMVSYSVAALGCVFAALCYAEFASMAPVAGSAYTYAYTTLGEIFAWAIGWDLMLEYAMACATVAAAWTHYFNEFLDALGLPQLHPVICSDPFTPVPGYEGTPWLNLPAVLIMLAVTVVLVRGIRESATTNAVLVIIKVAVVLFVIAVGAFYVQSKYWTDVPVSQRMVPEELAVPGIAKDAATEELTEAADKLASAKPTKEQIQERAAILEKQLMAAYQIGAQEAESAKLLADGEITETEAQARIHAAEAKYAGDLPQSEADKKVIDGLLVKVRKKATEKWGLLGEIGLNRWLGPVDESTRSRFMPYGLSGLMLGASIVFFAFIGFDSISTHAEEARHPQRDVPFGILASLILCTVLYIGVSAVITGMMPYPTIDRNAAIAAAFGDLAKTEQSRVLGWAHGLIAVGGLAGMTSVLLITFLSQVRVFMAMSRDGLLPRVFGHVHPRFKTPHLATMLTGGFICLVTAFTPIRALEEMVNIGTLLAFVVVCGSVLALRIQRPEVHRPFLCPWIYVMAPAGVIVNLTLMLFLPMITWLRLAGWLFAGLLIYLLYGQFHSKMGHATIDQLQRQGLSPTDAPLPPNS